jgi:transmembrane sensor
MMEAERSMINHLIVQRLRGKRLSVDEQKILEDWLADPANRAFFDEMSDGDKLLMKFEEYHYFQKAANEGWLKFVELAGGMKVRSLKPPGGWQQYMVAASVFFILAIGGFVLFTRKDKVEPAPKNNSQVLVVPPGKDGAILSLANGEKIVLDDATNGLLAKQGEVQVTKKDGVLSYSPEKAEGGKVVYNTLSTPRGRQYQLALPDGSKIWLNASSIVKFPTAFSGSNRRIEVSGEVYLEVAKDTKRPFIISVDGSEVLVYGTSFNINAYSEEGSTKTTLIEGSISVRNGNKTMIVKPGQQVQVKGENIAVVENADAEAAVAWKNGMIVLDRADIHAMLRSISRWYDVEVEVKGNLVAPGFIGKVPRNLTLNQLLDALEMNSKLKFSLEGRKVIVSH